jgi:hypothetical protein
MNNGISEDDKGDKRRRVFVYLPREGSLLVLEEVDGLVE